MAKHTTPLKNGRSTVSPGEGVITVRNIQSDSIIYRLSSAYPVKLISPNTAYDRRAVLVFVLTYGGGLVAGDEVNMTAHVHSNSRLGLLTQGSTKVYKALAAGMAAIQNLTVTIEDGAALLILPDPVQPFKNSIYEQTQIFNMHENSSLLLLDWFSEGRRTMGEVWSLTSFRSKNEIWGQKTIQNDVIKLKDMNENISNDPPRRLLLRDNVVLNNAHSILPNGVQGSMEDMGIIGTLVIRGPLFENLRQFFLHEFEQEPRIGGKVWSEDVKGNSTAHSGILWSAASIRGFTVVKFGGKDVDEARQWLRGMMAREGTVEKEFGKRFLLCLQDR